MAHQNRSSFHQCQEVEESDPYVNAPGIKGVGEIGITGTAGAVANAVWQATGIRLRKFPITLDQLIEPR
jgi:xanthine dehydrogenase YagR molybdenum-binding subunit